MIISDYAKHWSFGKSQPSVRVTLEDGSQAYEIVLNVPLSYLDKPDSWYESYLESFGPLAQLGER